MAKPVNKKLLLKHTAMWALFFAISFLPLFGYMHLYGVLEWIQLAFGIISSVATFYATVYFTGTYLDCFHWDWITEKRFLKKIGLLTKWPSLMILLIFGANLGISLWLGDDFSRYIRSHVPPGGIMETGPLRAFAFTFVGVFYGRNKWRMGQFEREMERLEAGGGPPGSYRLGPDGLESALGEKKTKN